ncbi:MAG: hypothetical protein OXG72_05065 [Acidobacteria bacterium]|nr:hypothetical protein [Acidobacteriota bacterium]
MAELLTLAGLNVTVTLGVAFLLWRALSAQIGALGQRVDALALTATDVDRRLARLEGRFDGWQDRATGWPAEPE